MRRLASAHLAALVTIAFTVAAPALAQESVRVDADAAVVASGQREIAAGPTIGAAAVAGPVSILPKPPEDIPPSLHEKIRLLMTRLDNAYPDASEARKLHFIADYLDIDFRRLWNAYHPDRPDRPETRPADARPVDARPVDRVRPDRVRPVDPQRIRPAAILRLRPAPATRPVRPRG